MGAAPWAGGKGKVCEVTLGIKYAASWSHMAAWGLHHGQGARGRCVRQVRGQQARWTALWYRQMRVCHKPTCKDSGRQCGLCSKQMSNHLSPLAWPTRCCPPSPCTSSCTLTSTYPCTTQGTPACLSHCAQQPTAPAAAPALQASAPPHHSSSAIKGTSVGYQHACPAWVPLISHNSINPGAPIAPLPHHAPSSSAVCCSRTLTISTPAPNPDADCKLPVSPIPNPCPAPEVPAPAPTPRCSSCCCCCCCWRAVGFPGGLSCSCSSASSPHSRRCCMSSSSVSSP